MSVFSDTLTRYIEHKNIKVFSLAKYCNLDLRDCIFCLQDIL